MDHSFSKNCKYVTNKDFIKNFVDQIDNLKEKLDENFNKLRKIAEDDILKDINKENAIEEASANISRYQRWLDRFYKLKIDLNNHETKLKKIRSELRHHYKYNSDISDSIKSDTALKSYIEGNLCYLKYNEYIENKKVLVEFVEGTIKNLHNRNFTIKNIIEMWGYELGIVK
ncbi:MAG: recombination mediator protein UvsY [Atribacterota bacterium]